jgi:hypothetical protein
MGELVYVTTISIKLFYTRISSSIRRQWIRWLAAPRRKQLNATANSNAVANHQRKRWRVPAGVVQLLIPQLKLPARRKVFYAPSDQGEGGVVQLLGSLNRIR